MTFEVRILRRGQADIEDIYQWLRQRSPTGAAAWYAAIVATLDRLADVAATCPAAAEAATVGVDLRQALFKTRRGRTYRILFLIVDAEVRVLRVRGPGQRPIAARDLATDDA